MSSLFELPLEPTEGSDVTKWYYQQITANGATNVNVTTTNTLSFQFAPQGRRWFVPSRSYFRIVGQAGGTVIEAKNNTRADDKLQWQDLKPAVGGAANFFQSVKVMIGGTLVSSVESRMPLIETVSKRIDRTASFLNSHEKSANYWSSSQTTGDSWELRSNGTAAGFLDFEYLWTPPLGFFQIDHAIPGMEMTVELITDPKWQNQAFEAASGDTVHGKATKEILYPTWQNVTIVFHAAFVEGPRADDSKFVLNFDEWSAHELPYNNQCNFTVKPETNLIVVGTQDSRVKNDLFKAAGRLLCYDALNTSASRPRFEYEAYSNGLRQIQIEYNGQMFPAQPHAGLPGQLVYDNSINNGQYSTEGGTETTNEFLGLGQMMVIQTPKDGTSYATAVGVYTQTADYLTGFTANVKMILLARAPKSLLVRTADSMIVTVQSSDVARTDRGLGNAQAAGSGMARRGLFGNFY